jgi:hypothetical protein
MNPLNVMFALLFMLAVIYLFMGMTAYSHTIKDDRTDKMLAISPWWAVYTSIYDEFGQKLSKYGKAILVVEAVGFTIWMLFR